MKLERTILDRFINGAFLNKRKIGRPIKYHIRSGKTTGWQELIFNPRNRWELAVSKSTRFLMPYLTFFTYRFHVERARDAGIRIEDFYWNKFHKEPYIHFHLYAQYFHPNTVQERVRDVAFYRRPLTLFKGFKVPDWATAEKRSGWEVDSYSRLAWDNALEDLRSEWTPKQFVGQRLEPVILNIFRQEQWGKGASSRLFYNEVPNPTWMRQKGHLDDPEKVLYSFTHANQNPDFTFGIDTTTPEGKENFRREWEALAAQVPEIISKDNVPYPHEQKPTVVDEPHFRRLWQHYREYSFRGAFESFVESGEISKEDADSFRKFVSVSHVPSFTTYIYGKLGKLSHLENDAGFQATMKVMGKLGLDKVTFSQKTAMGYEEQFWEQFDDIYGLNEEEMRRLIPNIVVDPSNKAHVEAIMAGRGQEALGSDSHKHINV